MDDYTSVDLTIKSLTANGKCLDSGGSIPDGYTMQFLASGTSNGPSRRNKSVVF